MLYNTRRQHGHNSGLSPVDFEKQDSKRGFQVSAEAGAIHIDALLGKVEDKRITRAKLIAG